MHSDHTVSAAAAKSHHRRDEHPSMPKCRPNRTLNSSTARIARTMTRARPAPHPEMLLGYVLRRRQGLYAVPSGRGGCRLGERDHRPPNSPGAPPAPRPHTHTPAWPHAHTRTHARAQRDARGPRPRASARMTTRGRRSRARAPAPA